MTSNFLELTIDETCNGTRFLNIYEMWFPELPLLCVDWKTTYLITFSSFCMTSYCYHNFNMNFLHGVSKQGE